jgi:thioesterase domain-containing protein
MGGLIAFEIAKQLPEQGIAVELLIALDSPSPWYTAINKDKLLDSNSGWLEQGQQFIDDLFAEEGIEKQADQEAQKADEWGNEKKFDFIFQKQVDHLKDNDNMITRTIIAHLANFKALKSYTSSGSFKGDLLLFMVESNQGYSEHWAQSIDGHCELFSVSGDHDSMLNEKNSLKIAEGIGGFINKISNKKEGIE